MTECKGSQPMMRLAKLGFTHSYTYFTWRNSKHELTEYLLELTRSEAREYLRPNFFVNTPLEEQVADQLGAEDAKARLKAETDRRRLQIDARKWAAGKFNRLLYADNPERAGVSVTINNHDDGRVHLEEIRQRLARRRATLEGSRAAEDATVVPRKPETRSRASAAQLLTGR